MRAIKIINKEKVPDPKRGTNFEMEVEVKKGCYFMRFLMLRHETMI